MARRLLTTEAVLGKLELYDDFDTEEPMVAGSDDEFDNIDDVYLEDALDEDDDDDCCSNPLPDSDASGSSSDMPPCWSSTLIACSHHHPIDTFQLMFTLELPDEIVKQINLYAQEVIEEEKYCSKFLVRFHCQL